MHDAIERALTANDAALLSELTTPKADNVARNGKQHLGNDDSFTHLDISQPRWPDPLRPAAFCGVAGELVRLIEPHSETDPAAILVQFLVGFGNLISRSAHFVAEADKHFASLYAVIVGQTSKGRKGTSWGQVRRVLEKVDAPWADTRIVNGLASGEGLIFTLGNDNVPDKRLLVVETEFARVLQVCEREGNTLSAVIRQAWDTGTLRTMTRKDPLHAADAHISIIGHITRDELRRRLDLTDWVPDFKVTFHCGRSECRDRIPPRFPGWSGYHSLYVEVKPYEFVSQFDGHASAQYLYCEPPAAMFGINPTVTEWEMAHGSGSGVYNVPDWVDDDWILWAEAGNITRWNPDV